MRDAANQANHYPFDKMSESRQILELPSPLRLYAAALATLGKKASSGTSSARLPDLRLERPAVRLDAGHVAEYAEVCGFAAAHGIPLTYPHLLAFPLHIMLMADRSFPYSMMGLVHLANSIDQHAHLSPDETVKVEVGCGTLSRHEKGLVFGLLTKIYSGQRLVWESDSTYLRTGLEATEGAEYASRLPAPQAREPAQRWTVDGGMGRRYGRISGDLNPIHMYRLSANLFGFRRAIAHGMWTKARALAALMPAVAVESAAARVEFKTPLYLPGAATLWADPYSGGQVFEVKDASGEKPHLRGMWSS